MWLNSDYLVTLPLLQRENCREIPEFMTLSAQVTHEAETEKYVPAVLQEYFWSDEQLMARKEK